MNTATNPSHLEVFTARVVATAKACKTGRFGASKVFVSHVYAAGFADRMTLKTFKFVCADAMRAGLLALSRADLVGAMNPEDVAASEVKAVGGACFHFVRID